MSEGERYQLTLHAKDLPNCRFFGTSCPFAKVKVTSGPNEGLSLGETEPIRKDLNPTWTKIFFLNFLPSDRTDIEVVIFDYRGDHKEPTWMGQANFEATSVFQSPGKLQSEQIGRADSGR
jgi:hypothetical protein